MDDMRMKLQNIQTGKAYLEKKIQEYESRLTQMKVKKDRHTNKMKNIWKNIWNHERKMNFRGC